MSLIVDASQFKSFFDRLGQAAKGQFRDDMATYLDAVAEKFLNSVQAEIEHADNIQYSLLIESFGRGNPGNVFKVEDGGLMLEVGTTVNYAGYVNKGHAQEPGRFIPGTWGTLGSKAVFNYDPGAKGGMVLKASWVDGSHYWDAAVEKAKATVPPDLHAKVKEWLAQYLGG